MSDTASNIVLALFGYNRAGKILWTVITVAGLGVFLVRTGLLTGLQFTEADERLFRAARHGDRAGIEQALATGAEVNAASPLDGKTALFRAAVFGHADAVKALLGHGANPAAHGFDDKSAIEIVTSARADEKDPAAAQALDQAASVLRAAEAHP
jgi:hypothetical protein